MHSYRIKNRLILFLGFSVCLSFVPADAAEVGDSKWNVMGGYSFTHTDLGQTEVWVETVFLAGGYERVLTDKFGPSWLKGYHSVRFEVPVHYVFVPDSGLMTGLNFIGLWSFTDLLTEYKPYLLAGGGPVYIDADIPGMSKDVNGTYMFGAGVEFDAGLSHKLMIEYRFSHVSNGGQEEPNFPLNSSNLMVGFAF